MSSKLIAPSILAADFANLQRDIEMVNHSEADWFHIDVMDGHFVPNISYGMPVIQAIKKHATKPLDVHLMIEKPERYIEEFAKIGADIITVHYESTIHLHRTLTQIEDAGCKAGVVLNLTTPVSVLEDILPKEAFSEKRKRISRQNSWARSTNKNKTFRGKQRSEAS